MTLSRPAVLILTAALSIASAAQAQTQKTRVTLAMVLEPTGLDQRLRPPPPSARSFTTTCSRA